MPPLACPVARHLTTDAWKEKFIKTTKPCIISEKNFPLRTIFILPRDFKKLKNTSVFVDKNQAISNLMLFQNENKFAGCHMDISVFGQVLAITDT